MRFIFTIVCLIAAILSLTTALPANHDRMRRGPVDLSGLTGGGMSFICVFAPCPVQQLVFPSTIDWDAIHASIAQWNKDQEELLLSQTDD
jgi:hypothetical protein